MKNQVYQIITDRIIDMLKKGVAPWHQPWKVTCLGNECGAFFNLKSKKPYRGVNVLLLSGNPYTSPFFVTFKQAKEMGGSVRPGEKGFPVTFWKRIDIEEDVDGDKVKKTIPFLRYYTVFNVEQCDGLEAKLPKTEKREATEEEKEQIKSEALNEADNIVESMPKRPDIFHGGNRACYMPMLDRVQMPEPKAFKDLEHYYSTLFHELVHSTGHPCRLHRKGVEGAQGDWTPFGSPDYAKEELVAEMGAAFLCGHLGIENHTINDSASYLQSWASKLEEDPKLFVFAASAAQKAADFILGKAQGSRDDNDMNQNERTSDEA